VAGVANEAEANRWNHPAWVTAWPNRERLTNAVSPLLLEVVDARAGQTVCDVGCGGGSLSMTLADAVAPGGVVVGIDISVPLLRLASQRASESGCGNVRFVEMDMQTGDGEPGPFDVAVSQFGVMFFDEPLAALKAVRRRMRAGGRFVFACWTEVERNPWHVGSALRSFLPAPKLPVPGKSPVGPFSFGDEEYVR
jgi:ubiquinone/menaquinone biosynthesis C-methylase UbiE